MAVFLAALMLVAAARAVSAQAPPSIPAPAYTIKSLGTLCVPTPELGCESAESFGLDVNNLGQVVGTPSRIHQSGPGQFALISSAFRTSPGQPMDPFTDELDDSESQVLLQAAEEAIDRNQHDVAGVQLNAYEQEVRALVQGRQLTAIQGTTLLAGATLIRRVIEEEGRRPA